MATDPYTIINRLSRSTIENARAYIRPMAPMGVAVRNDLQQAAVELFCHLGTALHRRADVPVASRASLADTLAALEAVIEMMTVSHGQKRALKRFATLKAHLLAPANEATTAAT
jgi:hypothetical protein